MSSDLYAGNRLAKSWRGDTCNFPREVENPTDLPSAVRGAVSSSLRSALIYDLRIHPLRTDSSTGWMWRISRNTFHEPLLISHEGVWKRLTSSPPEPICQATVSFNLRSAGSRVPGCCSRRGPGLFEAAGLPRPAWFTLHLSELFPDFKLSLRTSAHSPKSKLWRCRGQPPQNNVAADTVRGGFVREHGGSLSAARAQRTLSN